MNQVLFLKTTENNKKAAKKLAKLLISRKLAACVSLKDIHSLYEWEGKIEEVNEVEITIKSKPELKNALIFFLHKNNHYYENHYLEKLKQYHLFLFYFHQLNLFS